MAILAKAGGLPGRALVAKTSWLLTLLMSVLAHFTYVALAAVLILAGMGLPIPEDIPLILSGYMCDKDYSPINQIPKYVDTDGDGIKETQVPRVLPKLEWMVVAGMVGVLLGDSIVFSIGRRGMTSNSLVARHLRKVMHSKRREWVERHFARHGNLTIFFGRFAPFLRSIVFGFAGMSKMSYARFLLVDGLAAALSVPLFIYIGYHFAQNVDSVMSLIARIKHVLLPVALAAIVIAVVLYILRRRRGPAALEHL